MSRVAPHDGVRVKRSVLLGVLFERSVLRVAESAWARGYPRHPRQFEKLRDLKHIVATVAGDAPAAPSDWADYVATADDEDRAARQLARTAALLVESARMQADEQVAELLEGAAAWTRSLAQFLDRFPRAALVGREPLTNDALVSDELFDTFLIISSADPLAPFRRSRDELRALLQQ